MTDYFSFKMYLQTFFLLPEKLVSPLKEMENLSFPFLSSKSEETKNKGHLSGNGLICSAQLSAILDSNVNCSLKQTVKNVKKILPLLLEKNS